MALPTLWDCSHLVSDAKPRAEVLLVEDDSPICLATLAPELLVDDEDSLTDEEERDEDDELLTDEEDLFEDELLDTLELFLRLLS